MKKLLLVIAIVLPTLTKSQDTIHIPYSVAKQIAKDLVSYDSTRAILELTNEQLSLTEQKVVLKDSIIAGHVQKGLLYEERIGNEQKKYGVLEGYVKDLQKKNKKLKVKLLFTKITLSAVIGGLTYLYITK